MDAPLFRVHNLPDERSLIIHSQTELPREFFLQLPEDIHSAKPEKQLHAGFRYSYVARHMRSSPRAAELMQLIQKLLEDHYTVYDKQHSFFLTKWPEVVESVEIIATRLQWGMSFDCYGDITFEMISDTKAHFRIDIDETRPPAMIFNKVAKLLIERNFLYEVRRDKLETTFTIIGKNQPTKPKPWYRRWQRY